MPTFPTSFSIPDSKWKEYEHLRQVSKTKGFSDWLQKITPQKKHFHSEEAKYLASYSECYFAITFRKGGWESLRHYEMLIAGAIPYYLHIDQIPENSMYKFPKALIQEAMSLPGVPNQKRVYNYIINRKYDKILIDFNLFDQDKYFEIRAKIFDFIQMNLLSSIIANDIIVSSSEDPPKTILMHSVNQGGPQDYQRDLILIGLFELGYIIHTTFDISYLFSDFDQTILTKLYGKGFTYGRCLTKLHKENWIFIKTMSIENITWDDNVLCIISTKSNHSFPNNWTIYAKYAKNLIFLNGNDDMPSEKHQPPIEGGKLFIREYNSIHLQEQNWIVDQIKIIYKSTEF